MWKMSLFLHNSIVLAISVPKFIEFGGDLTKFKQNKLGILFLAHRVCSPLRCVHCQWRYAPRFWAVGILSDSLFVRKKSSKKQSAGLETPF